MPCIHLFAGSNFVTLFWRVLIYDNIVSSFVEQLTQQIHPVRHPLLALLFAFAISVSNAFAKQTSSMTTSDALQCCILLQYDLECQQVYLCCLDLDASSNLFLPF